MLIRCCITALLLTSAAHAQTGAATMTIRAGEGETTIAPEIYGHFAEHLGRCIYGGIWVGPDSDIPNTQGIRNDVLDALKKLDIPVLRWPGGCFADDYHWRDGIGPRETRPTTINIHWGDALEPNSFGTHEFMLLCELLDTEAYIAGNVGSGTVQEMREWVEYLTFAGPSTLAKLRAENGHPEPWRVRYFGVGNENWGCGGFMTPEYYSDLYRRFSMYVRDMSGNDIVRIACGPGGVNNDWMRVVMEQCHRSMDAISMHYYVFGEGGWNNKGSATDFEESAWFSLMKETLGVDQVIRDYREIMDEVDPSGRIGLYVDEYGTWWDPAPDLPEDWMLYQQNTLRDAVCAGIFLNIFNQHAERVRMGNIAQTVNVLQAMVLTDGPKMLVTPTYHVFEMYKVHQGATYLPMELASEDYQHDGESIPAVSASASRNGEGVVHITACNLDPKRAQDFTCTIEGASPSQASGRVLTADAMHSHNTFDAPETVTPRPLEGVTVEGNRVRVSLPAKSVAVLAVQ